MNRAVVLTVVLNLCFCGCLSAQSNGDNQAKYVDILPPSPAVAKLSDFSRPDVGMMTGTAQFHLPLTALQVAGFSVPVAVNYSSNGVKVDEISSRAGMGMQF